MRAVLTEINIDVNDVGMMRYLLNGSSKDYVVCQDISHNVEN